MASGMLGLGKVKGHDEMGLSGLFWSAQSNHTCPEKWKEKAKKWVREMLHRKDLVSDDGL